MILRSIRVEGWRCFASRVTVGPFVEGLNVLHAPNGTGKSTLFEALLRALMDPHSVSGRDVEALRPWGRALTPTVSVEFVHRGISYRLKKRFLDRPSSQLERFEQGIFVPLAQGDEADEQVRAMLSHNPPGRGLSRPENWGLAQVLWAPQGRLAMGKLSGDVVADIRTSLGAHVLGPGGGAIEQRIEKAYAEFYTPLGKLRTGRDAPAVVKTRERLSAAIEQQHKAKAQHEAFERASRRVEELCAERAEAQRIRGEIAKSLNEAREQARAYATLTSERRECEARAREAEARHREIKQHIAAVHAARRELREVTEALARLHEDAPLHEHECEAKAKEVAAARHALEDARRALREAENATVDAEDARHFVEAMAQRKELDARLSRAEAARKELTVLARERRALSAPDAGAMREIRRAAAKRDEARARLDAAMITLELVTEREETLEVIAGETSKGRTLRAGQSFLVRGSPEVIVEIAGFGRVHARGPTTPIEQRRADLDRAEQALAKICAPYGSTDLETLEARCEAVTEIDARRAKLEVEIQTLLGRDGEAEHKGAEYAEVVATVLDKHPAWASSPPDPSALRAEAERARQTCTKAVREAEMALEAAQRAHADAEKRAAALRARIEETERHARALKARLEELCADGRDDRAREADLAHAALAWDAAATRLAEANERLRAAGEDPHAAVVKLERDLAMAEKVERQALEAEKVEEGRLQHLSALGTYSVLSNAQEEVAKLEAQLQRDQLQAEAVKLLRATVARCRAEAVAAIAEPVAEAATRTLHRIAGERLGRLDLGESFEPRALRPSAAKAGVGLEEVSGGEQEQVHLATRLALAEVLASDERQLVVLDDALTATDAVRLARVLQVLEEAAKKLQVLVITCHPERYASLDGAHTIDLEALVEQAKAS